MSQKQTPNYLFPLIIVFIVCFLIGFITTMNNSMIAFLSEAFNLSAQQGQYVNTAFYGAYLLAIPFAMLMSKIGYKGANGATFPRRSAVCFEAQHFPDSPNRPYFPSVILNPGQRYKQKTIYRFGVVE